MRYYDVDGNEIQIGSRVIVVDECGFADNRDTIGKIGTVVDEDDFYDIGVEFDEPINQGHDCNGAAKFGHGYYGYVSEVRLYEDRKVEISMSFDAFMADITSTEGRNGGENQCKM